MSSNSEILNNCEKTLILNLNLANIDELTIKSRLFQEMLSIFENAAECKTMLSEAEGDQEILDMVQEEKEALQGSLDELYDEITVNLLEPLKYDDCNEALLEFRPGIHLK